MWKWWKANGAKRFAQGEAWCKEHPQRVRMVGGTLVLHVLGLLLWPFPYWLVSRYPIEPKPDPTLSYKDFIELVDAYRRTVAQIIAGLVGLIVVYLTWRRIKATEDQVSQMRRTVEVAQEGQITERYTRAIEQLAHDKMEVRLGGIYALERIAKDSNKDYWTIMEVLTAYVRENAAVKNRPEGEEVEPEEAKDTEQTPEQPSMPTDIQAVMTVLGRREVDPEETRRLDLYGTDLSGVYLRRANLSRANLSRVNLSRVNLNGAKLSGAILFETDLSGAFSSGANLSGAILFGVNLSGATHLTQKQVDSALPDEDTKLPEYLTASASEGTQHSSGENHLDDWFFLMRAAI
jgi:hypothetical protein